MPKLTYLKARPLITSYFAGLFPLPLHYNSGIFCQYLHRMTTMTSLKSKSLLSNLHIRLAVSLSRVRPFQEEPFCL